MPFSPYPEMRDIYTAVQIRGQSAAALTAGARVNDGRTATAGCALRLARAVARAPGNFAVNEIIGWTGLRWAAFRLRLHRLGTATAASAISRFPWLFGDVGDFLEGGAAQRRSPPGQNIALQPRVVPAGRLQRTLGNRSEEHTSELQSLR